MPLYFSPLWFYTANMSKFKFRYLVYPLALSALTWRASYIWLRQMPDGGGFAALYILPAAILLGLVCGIVVAWIQKKYPRIAMLFLVIYIGYFGGYIAYHGPFQNIKASCANRVLSEFKKSRDVDLMDSWCIDKYQTGRFLSIAESLHDAETLTAVVEKSSGFHRNLKCSYLKIAVATGDLKSIERYMDKGVSPLCESNRVSPYSYLRAETGRLKGNPKLQQEVLNQLSRNLDDQVVIKGDEKPFIVETLIKKGSPVTLNSVLTAIRSKNYQVLEMLLRHFNVNKESGGVHDPLAFAINMKDASAVRLLLQYGADKNRYIADRGYLVKKNIYALRRNCSHQLQIKHFIAIERGSVAASSLPTHWRRLKKSNGPKGGRARSLNKEWRSLIEILRMLGGAPQINDCFGQYDSDNDRYWRQFFFNESTNLWKLSESK